MHRPSQLRGLFYAGTLGKRLCRMDYKTVAEVATVALAGSELLSLVPNVKANSWVQLGLNLLQVVAASGKQKQKRRR